MERGSDRAVEVSENVIRVVMSADKFQLPLKCSVPILERNLLSPRIEAYYIGRDF